MNTNVTTEILNFITHMLLALGLVINGRSCRRLAETQVITNSPFKIQNELNMEQGQLNILIANELNDMQQQINELRAEIERLEQK